MNRPTTEELVEALRCAADLCLEKYKPLAYEGAAALVDATDALEVSFVIVMDDASRALGFDPVGLQGEEKRHALLEAAQRLEEQA